jgi:large subunit ribosomal protein L25
LVYVNVIGQSYPTIIHDVARDTLTDGILHADFYKVRLDEKIKTNVPVVFVGESSAVKDLGGIFVRNINELEVEALPQNLPHEIAIDISSLKNFGDQILVKDIDLGASVKIEATAETIIATVQEPMSEEELKASLETPTAGVEEVEVIKKEKPEETAEETAEAPVGEKK